MYQRHRQGNENKRSGQKKPGIAGDEIDDRHCSLQDMNVRVSLKYSREAQKVNILQDIRTDPLDSVGGVFILKQAF